MRLDEVNKLSPDMMAANAFMRKYKPPMHECYRFANGVMNVDGDVFLADRKISKLPIKFGVVTGMFNIGSNPITSIEGFPSEIHGVQLSMRQCPHLKSLKDIHKIIKKAPPKLFIEGTPIERNILGLILLDGLKEVHYMNDVSDFKLHAERMQAFKIVCKNIGKGRAGVLAAQEELLDQGLDDYSEL